MVIKGYFQYELRRNCPINKLTYKNKDITTRMLVNQGMASELKDRIKKAKSDILEAVDVLNGKEETGIDDAAMSLLSNQISLGISDAYKKEKVSM